MSLSTIQFCFFLSHKIKRLGSYSSEKHIAVSRFFRKLLEIAKETHYLKLVLYIKFGHETLLHVLSRKNLFPHISSLIIYKLYRT